MDGTVTIFDASKIQKKLAAMTEMDDVAVFAGDADEDGDLSVIDAALIQRHCAGMADQNNVGTHAKLFAA